MESVTFVLIIGPCPPERSNVRAEDNLSIVVTVGEMR
jgi:hypothetical protein